MLSQKIILLTGGSDGIGWKCAEAYANAGAVVCILDTKPLTAEQEAKLKSGGQLFIKGDVSNDTAVKYAVDQIIERYGRIDAVHNNAGTASPSKPLHSTTTDEWNKVMEVNLKSILLTTSYCIEHLKKVKGSILNTSSMVGSLGQENHAAYVASKGAVNALTKAMALDYAAFGIRVNAVAPAAISTPMLRLWSAEQPNQEAIEKYLDKLQPLGKMPEGDVIADACVFLLSEAARFITGCILPVSGGAELGYRNQL